MGVYDSQLNTFGFLTAVIKQSTYCHQNALSQGAGSFGKAGTTVLENEDGAKLPAFEHA